VPHLGGDRKEPVRPDVQVCRVDVHACLPLDTLNSPESVTVAVQSASTRVLLVCSMMKQGRGALCAVIRAARSCTQPVTALPCQVISWESAQGMGSALR